MTPLGDQRAVAALPVSHQHSMTTEILLEQLAPQRIVVLPRDANRPLYDGILADCRDVGLSPTLVEMADANIEQALLAVASGAGLALLPESVAERYRTPGIRFVPLGGDATTFATAILTRTEERHRRAMSGVRLLIDCRLDADAAATRQRLS
jgi:DNA-binding transcriptional LysR family regulator